MKKEKKLIVFLGALLIVIVTVLLTILLYTKKNIDISNDDPVISDASDSKYDISLDNPHANIDFSEVDILSLEELYAMNPDNSVEFEYNNYGKISRIKGLSADFKVNNSDDALKVLYGLQEILALCDINDLRFLDEYHDAYDDIYSFEQYINGIAVNSGIVTVIAYADTKYVYIVNSYCIPDFNTEATYGIDQNEAIQIVKNKEEFNVNDITKIELIIYNDFFKGNVLTWYIETDSFDAPTIYLDANTGEILYYDAPIID